MEFFLALSFKRVTMGYEKLKHRKLFNLFSENLKINT